jgi:uridylate kinase
VCERQKVEVGIVVGGGNIFRGAALAQAGMNRCLSTDLIISTTWLSVFGSCASHVGFSNWWWCL